MAGLEPATSRLEGEVTILYANLSIDYRVQSKAVQVSREIEVTALYGKLSIIDVI